MKQNVLFTVILLSLVGLLSNVQAQTIFSAVSPSGHTLYYKVIDQDNHLVEVTYPGPYYYDGEPMWEGYTEPSGHVTIPSTVLWNNMEWTVYQVGDHAFAWCHAITSVTLSEGIEQIRDYALAGTFVDSIIFPSTLTVVAWGALEGCDSLRYINLPAGLNYFDPVGNVGMKSIIAYNIEEGSLYYRSIEGCLLHREPGGWWDLVAYPRGRNHGVVEIPEGVNWAGMWPIGGLHGSKLILPSTLTQLCYSDDTNWVSFDTIVFHGITPPVMDWQCATITSGTFQQLKIPCGAWQNYTTSIWGQFVDRLVINENVSVENFYQTIAYGESFIWDSMQFDVKGVYSNTVQSVVEGCDSVHRVLTLNVLQTYRSDVLLTEGMSVDFHGLVVNRPGIYEVMAIGDGDFDSLFVLRASAEVNATMATVEMGGVWESDSLTLPAMQSQVFVRGEDSITVTNIHQIIHNTVDVTINEGENYNGRTLAGVYQDTLYFADYDSIIRSRVSMNVNRPMDSCMVHLERNINGYFFGDLNHIGRPLDDISLQVLPGQNKQVLFSAVITANDNSGIPSSTNMFVGNGSNLIPNGDFEHGNTGFTTDYTYTNDCNYAGCGNETYSIQQGFGVDGSYGMGVDGAVVDKLLYEVTIPNAPGLICKFSYMARTENHPSPYFAVLVNGVQIDSIDYVPNNNDWVTFEHIFTSGSSSIVLQLYNRNLEGGGNDFFMDNFRLEGMLMEGVAVDTITITNTHGMVRDTVDVTITEGENYRGYTLAGVYQDTIIGNETDSIVYSRVSMNINHTFGIGSATLATNLEGRVWKGQDNKVLSTQPTLTVQVDPATEQRYVLTSLSDGGNMQPNGDFERWQDNWSSEYAWGDSPFQGSHYVTLCDTCGRTGRGLSVKGSMMSDRAFYQSEWMNLVEGHRYSFSYWTKSHSVGQPAELAIKVNDQQYEWQLPETDILTETEWTRHEHIFTARRTYATLMRIFDLNTSQNGNEFFLDDVSLVDLTEDSMARRDTVAVNNIHQLRYATVDTAISEGENYHGYTVADIYRDTVVMADYDSITTARVSYVLNTTGEGITTLGHSQPGEWLDLDNNRIYTDSTVSVYPTEVRRFGLLTLAQDTNLIVNGDFEQDTVGFTSHYSYRPEPYPFSDDNTYYVGSYRISQDPNNHFLHCHNYWYPRQGAYYSTTVSVAPNTWYRFSYKAGIESNTNNGNIIEVNERQVAIDTFAHRSANNWTGRMFDYTHVIYSGDTTMLTIVMDQRLENAFEFVVDDITLTPFTISDSIYITNRHQMLYDTVEVTINEGQAYNGHTLAGVYQDTIIGADADSIIRSRVSMNVNRPMDNCMVQLGSNLDGSYVADDQVYYGDNMEVQVIPGESKQMAFSPLQYQMGNNMVVNGDFEQGDYYPYVGDYATDDGDGYGSRTYGIQEGNGVDGSRCMWFGGSSLPDQALFRITIPTTVGYTYRFSYSALATIYSMPFFAVKVNGQQIDNNDIVPQENEWITFSHDIVATSGNTLVELVDLNTEWNGNDFLIDNLSLICLITAATATDTISITNIHGMVGDTVDVTISENESYRGHTLAGVYNDTIIGANADSIIHSRVSMNVNRPMDSCMVQLGGNMDGTYFTESGTYAAGTQLQVLPSESKTILYTPDVLGKNLLAISNWEEGEQIVTKYSLYAGDYVADPNGSGIEGSYHWGGGGSYGDGLLFIASNDTTDAFFRTIISSKAGDRYNFHYKALATNNHTTLALKVNGELVYPINSFDHAINHTWGTFEYVIEATSDVTTIELVDLQAFTGTWGDNMWFVNDVSLTKTFSSTTDTVTITNTHGMVFDTVNVTINEGESYRGHTLAGVYQDTIIGVDADSIIRSRVSMNVNRPLDSCMVQLGGIYYENLDESVQIEVLPSSSLTFRFSSSHTGNLLINGDFEQGNTGFYTEYTYSDCGGMGCGYRTYSINTYAGVDGSICTGWDGAVEPDIVLWQQIVATEPGCRYRFSYMEGGSNDQAPYFAFLVNGNQVGDIDYASNRQGEWITFEHEFIATSYSTVLQLFDRNLEGGGNDFYLDNLSLVCISLADGMVTDSIIITNMHGLVRDTLSVTINEGESYRGHTLAGVYQNTIIGVDADSIIRSRVSMNVNRPMDNCMVQLGGNQGGTYIIGDEFYADGNAAVQVPPADSKTLMYTPEALGVNLLTFGDENYSNYNQYCGDFCNNTFQWGGRGYNGSEALYVGFGCYENLAFFRIALDSKAGEQYKFSFMANSCNMNRQVLAVKVNGVQLSQVDSLAYYVEGTENQWGSFEHLITATGDTTVIELVNLQADAGDWFMDNFRLMKVYTTVTDSITITNTHGLVIDTLDVTINEGESYHGHSLAGVYQDTILGVETDSIVYARVSMNINHSFGAGTATLATNQEGRVWMGLDDAAIGTQPTLTVQVNPARENRYVLTSLADGSNMQPNGDFERWQDNWSTEYSWGDIPFQGSHHVTLCDTCGRTGRGLAVKGSQLLNKYVYNSEWVNLMVGHRYSFSYWAKSRAANPATLAIAINDQQQEWRLDGCDSLGEAVGEWKRFEHVFTPQRTYSTLIRIVDLNTSAEGNEFFLDDISIVDLTEATDAYRDTVIVRNTHELHYTIVDTTLGEGESYNGHTLAGIYNDTLTFADRDSIVHSRISYALNTSGMGSTTLGSNLDITLVDLDYGTLYDGDSVSVWPAEVRRFGWLAQALQDTNLISNGDFEQGNSGFSSYYMFRPLPYGLDDSTFMIGGYRIAQNEGNNYFHALYNHANNGPAYTTTVNVEPGGWYLLSFRAVSTVCYADQNNMGPLFHVTVNGTDVASKRFLCSYYDDFYSVTNCGDIDQSGIHTQLVHSDDTVMTIALGHENADYWGWYHFAFDDIRLTPLAVIDTITVTNRHQLVYDTTRTDICQGGVYTVDSIDYANAGTYTLNTRYYIDSTVYPTLILGVHNNYYPQLTHAICEGESYAFGGNTLTETGSYVDSLTTVWGCDSTITLNLTVHAHTASQQIEDVCDSYLWHSTVYTASTTVIDTIDNVHGCDSVCTLNLTVRYSTTGDTTATACDLFNWYGQTYTASGMPTHLLTNVAGCDSTLTLNLTVNYSTSGSETFTVCDSMTWHDVLYTASSTYQDVMTNSVNCDSTVTLYLTVNSSYHHTDAVFACDNQLPYLYHEQPLATAGDHTVQFQSMAGCDSTVTVTLTVGATYQHTDQLTLCQSGMPYSYGNQTFYENDTTGIYTIPFSTVEGCDSIINLDLTIHQSEATEIYVVTVQGTNNMVLWNKDAAVDHYNIYRESSTSGIYTLAAVVPYSEPSIWVDQESDNRVHAYRYRMTSVDSCGTESEQSPIHRTMHLTISQGINGSWNLVWTEYQGTTYSTYRIYRGSSYNDMTMIGEIPSDNTTYTDYSAPEGYVYYQIVVLLGSGSKDGSDGTIRSNVATNNQTGIGVAEDMNIPVRIASQNGSIVVETLIGEQVQVFDVVGRRLYNTISTGNDLFEMSSSGVYMVKVGTYPARRVVVTK